MPEAEDRAELEAQLERKAAAQAEYEGQVKLKIENLTAAIYSDICAKGIEKDHPMYNPDRVYTKSFEAAMKFAERMWNVRIQEPTQVAPPQPAELPETD